MKTKAIRLFVILLPAVVVAATAYARENHKAYRGVTLRECAECHQDAKVVPNHGGGWKAEHRILASSPSRNCYDCHDQGYCQDCHQGGGISASLGASQSRRDIKPESHRSDWISIHPIQAQSTPQTCARCHETSYCSNCHGRLQKNTLTIRSHAKSGLTQAYIASFPDEHAAEARRNLASCQSCHPDGNVCLTCHSAKIGVKVNPHPRNFKADRVGSKSNNRSCVVCH